MRPKLVRRGLHGRNLLFSHCCHRIQHADCSDECLGQRAPLSGVLQETIDPKTRQLHPVRLGGDWLLNRCREPTVLLEATVVHLSLASLDRYIAAFYSYRYPVLVTNSRVLKAMVASWAVLACLTLSVIERVFISLVIILPPNILFIGILYFRIFKEIRRLEANPVVSANVTEEQRKMREGKGARTVAMVLGLLFLCYIPMILFLAMFLVQRVLMIDRRVAQAQGLFVVITFAALNSSLNVFVYYCRNSEIRSSILKVLGPITQRFVPSVNPA